MEMKRTEENSLLLPKYDVIFKRIFGDQEIVSDFLRAVLEIPREDTFTVTFGNTELIAKTEFEKVTILDLVLTLEGKQSLMWKSSCARFHR